jgi:hypothetical protein
MDRMMNKERTKKLSQFLAKTRGYNSWDVPADLFSEWLKLLPSEKEILQMKKKNSPVIKKSKVDQEALEKRLKPFKTKNYSRF